MKSMKDVKKGKTVQLFDADFLSPKFSPSSNRHNHDAFFGVGWCSVCGKNVAIDSESITSLPSCGISKADLPRGRWSSFQYHCSCKCEERYQEMHVLDDVFTATQQFFERIKSNSGEADIDDLALYITSIICTKIVEDEVCERYKQVYKTSCQKMRGLEIEERVVECWLILASELNSLSKNEVTEKDAITLESFNSMFHLIRRQCLYQVSISHPLIQYIEEKLLKLSDDELNTALELLNSNLPRIENHDEDNLKVTKKLLRWRHAVRLVQTIDGNMLDDEVSSLIYDKKAIKSLSNLRRKCFALCPDLHLLNHSCLPNCIVQVAHDTGKIGLVALQDIKEGSTLKISMIANLGESVKGRQSQLSQVYGIKNYICNCVRCRCEIQWEGRDHFNVLGDNDNSLLNPHKGCFHQDDIKAMGDFAMQQARYKTAGELYRLALTAQPKNGDILHSICASFLERGCFDKAQDMWKDAHKLCPGHESIALQIKKQKAYYHREGFMTGTNDQMMQLKNNFYTTLIPKKAFVTKDDSPIISDNECSQAIEWAEAAAKVRKGGWTTSRHYAVPTTDMPLHDIPPLLNWFNEVLKNRLRPLLAIQFGEDEVGKQGSDVLIHDAFIVRYDASGGQKHLPLHRDQSTHSFTIALNSLSEYEGGGTYISSLKRSIIVDKGGALSFRGDQLLHGGDPIVSGCRYIIVAFCYVCKSSARELDAPPNKKMKNDFFGNKFKEDQSAKAGTGFSFGFQF